MKTVLCIRPVLGLAIVAVMVLAMVPPGASAAQRDGWLRISPGVYVGGQAITFEGNIGRRGVQRVHVEINMGPSGSSWMTPEGGFRARTSRDGSFRFRYPAPSMINIRVRVASARAATPARTLVAKSQEVVLQTDGEVRAGEPFRITADTTPDVPGRQDLPGPVIRGRELTLQQRVPDDAWHTSDWRTIGTTTTDDRGRGSFSVTVDSPGTVVFRVRQENWFVNGNRIGWYPSFPTYVDVLPGQSGRAATGPALASASGTRVPAGARSQAGTAEVSTPLRRTGGATTAHQSYGWGAALWDFAWEFGESLTSRPYRGTDRRGWWLDASDGTGRAAKHNGGLMLDSQLLPAGQGDRGTTWATLRGNPRAYGRWEAKLRLKSAETNARDYRVRLELIPDRPDDYHCGAQNITVAEVTAHASSLAVGAKALRGDREWTYRRPFYSLNGPSATFAVEVSRRHISWFANGRIIASVRSRAAVSDVPMTLRLGLAGVGQEEMNHTKAISDWQRGFSLRRGRLATRGHALQAGTHGGGC